ncbi:MAG: sugar phosphate isomerase/epimerase family protein, partial [Streptosporangiaceae bacterium]
PPLTEGRQDTMDSTWRVGFNPLTWYMTPAGSGRAAAPPLPEIYRRIRAAGFDAVHAEVPDGMSVPDYQALLADTGLAPAPGYFQARFSDPAAAREAVESGRRAAAQHTALGLSRIFIADQFGAQPRVAVPAQGAGFEEGRLAVIIDNLGVVAEAMVAEGVTPCLHQHVGTWIETPQETEAVLAAISPDLLLFGPDTGHLAWAGGDPAAIIGAHLDRVGAVHLKDVRAAVRGEAQASGRGYRETTARHVFTEPGRGDVNFADVLQVLARFDGWYVVEVDVADQPTPEDTARVSAEWVRAQLAGERAR